MPALLATGTAQRYADTFLSLPGVIGLWPLWEPFGTGVYHDLGPYHLDGTVSGTISPVGLSGSAADIAALGNGSSGLINCGNSSTFDLGDAASMVAVILRGATGANRAIMSKGGGGGPGAYYLRLNADGTLHYLRSNVADMVGSTVAVSGDRPHHVVGAKSGATIKLYIDGADVTGSVSNSTMNNTVRPFQIGCDQNSVPANADFFNSRLAMVGLLNRLLTATEAAMLAKVALQ